MKSAIAKGNVLSAVTKTPVATKAILVPQRSTINVYGNTGRAFLLSPIPSASARAALDSRYILLLNGHIESGSHMTEGDRKAIADLAKMVADLSTSIGNTQIDFSNLFEIVNQGQPNEYILAKLSFHSKNDVVAFSNGADGGTVPSIPIATYVTAGVVKVDPTTMTVDSAGVIAVKGDLFNLSNYWTKTDSDERYLLKTEKPDLTGYATKIYVDDQISTHTHTLYVKYQTPETPAPQTIYGDIRVIGKIYSSDDIVAFSNGTGGGTAPTIPLATYATTGVVKVDPSTMTVDANGMIAVKGDLFNLSNYYDKSASDGRFSAIAHRHNFSDIDGKPTTLGGYGITDGMTASQITTAIAQAKADIVNSSPAALDTLYEFAAALGNDPNFATTTATALGNRLRVDIATQGLTDTQRANGRANLGLDSTYLGIAAQAADSAKLGGRAAGDYWHVDNAPNVFAYRDVLVTNINFNTIHSNGVYFNAVGNGSGNSNVPDSYGCLLNLYTGYFNAQMHFPPSVYYGGVKYKIENNGFFSDWIRFWDESNLNRNDKDFTAKDVFASSTKFRASDGNVKWTARVSAAGDYLEFYNASGVLEMRLSQAGKVQARGDIEGFSNFS